MPPRCSATRFMLLLILRTQCHVHSAKGSAYTMTSAVGMLYRPTTFSLSMCRSATSMHSCTSQPHTLRHVWSTCITYLAAVCRGNLILTVSLNSQRFPSALTPANQDASKNDIRTRARGAQRITWNAGFCSTSNIADCAPNAKLLRAVHVHHIDHCDQHTHLWNQVSAAENALRCVRTEALSSSGKS